jgi:hypothetical protein
MDTKELRRSFWRGAAVAVRPASALTKCGSGLERCHPEPLSSIWAAGPDFRLPRFWLPKASACLELMRRHLSCRLSNAISQTHPSLAKPFRIRDSSIALSAEDQRRLIERIAGILVPGGRLLFTSPAEPVVWNDAMTGLESRSLGAAEYRRHMSAVGLSVAGEYDDEGQNHYFDAFKEAHFIANLR